MIQVFNLHEDTWQGRGDYIGRPSVLGNPFSLCQWSREEAVGQYRREWLWPIVKDGLAGKWTGKPSTLGKFEQFSRAHSPPIYPPLNNEEFRQAVWEALVVLCRRAAAGEDLSLLCYCKPLDCHGDVLKSCLEWLLQTSVVVKRDPPSLGATARQERDV
jgi:hypothetical protein